MRERIKFQYNSFTQVYSRFILNLSILSMVDRKSTSDTSNRLTHAFQKVFYIPREKKMYKMLYDIFHICFSLFNIWAFLAKVKSLVTHEWTHTPPNDHTWNYAQVKMHKSESLPRLLLLFVRSHVALPSAAYDYVRYLVYNKYIYYCTMRCIDMVQNISYHHGDVWSLRNEFWDRRNWYSSWFC